MPYIKQDLRAKVDPEIDALVKKIREVTNTISIWGVLNYCVTQLLRKIFPEPNYILLQNMIGTLQIVSMELYRRRMAPYEDRKAAENGDVYADELPPTDPPDAA